MRNRNSVEHGQQSVSAENIPSAQHAKERPVRKGRERGGARNSCRRSLHVLLKARNDRDIEGARIISAATQRERRQFFSRCIADLYDGGYKVRDVHHLRGKHIRYLVRSWETRGHSAPTLQKYHSFLRTLERWIEKRGLVRDISYYLVDPTRAARIRVATTDKSWTAKDVDPSERIAEVLADDSHAGTCLLLQAVFGLRAQEAWQLRPDDNDGGDALQVAHGTKGGLERDEPINTSDQRKALDFAKSLANAPIGSMIPAKYSLAAWRARFYRICRRHGISRKTGLVPHGLRHGFGNDLYEKLTGRKSPVRGGHPPLPAEREGDKQARQQIAKLYGHGRRKVSSAYLGTFLTPRNAGSSNPAESDK
jgi:integrase